MTLLKKIIGILILPLFLIGCSSNSNDANRIEFYILGSIEGPGEFEGKSPIFTGDDILSYDWDTHTILFKEEFLAPLATYGPKDAVIKGGSAILDAYYPEQFAVALDGEELYRGYMQPQGYSSFMPAEPIISDVEGGIIIRGLEGEKDTRNNNKLYKVLKSNGLLK